MLVLTRKVREQINVGDDIVITILRIKGQSVRVGIEAPKSMRVLRGELPDAKQPAAPEVTTEGRHKHGDLPVFRTLNNALRRRAISKGISPALPPARPSASVTF